MVDSPAIRTAQDQAQAAKDRKVQLMSGARVLFAYCNAAWGKHYREDDKRLGRLVQRLRENNADLSELFYAADGAKRDPWINGQDDKSKGYLQIQTVYRDREQVERLAELGGYKPGRIHPTLQQMTKTEAADVRARTHS
jgi:hypothetical protein